MRPFAQVPHVSTTRSRSGSSSVIVTPTNVPSSNGGIESEALKMLQPLDKGIRSGIVSQQCESIVRFSELIKKYPLPIVANTALLKLAEVFHASDNNFVRYWIVNVFEEVKLELPKVLNKNEMIKKTSVVLSSNDPIARALTLRLLSHMSSILSERTDVHHKIETCLLTSTDASEQEAAMLAVEQMCSVSSQFATQIQPKIEGLIKDLKTPISTKLKLIRVLKHMHTADAHQIQKTFETLKSLLHDYPSQDFYIVILDTATKLSVRSIQIAKETFTLLFTVLETDDRKKVKIECLKNLSQLTLRLTDLYASEFPHQVLKSLLVESPYRSIRQHAMQLLVVMSKSLYIVRTWFFKHSKDFLPFQIFEHFYFHKNDSFADLSLNIMINCVCHQVNKPIDNDVTDSEIDVNVIINKLTDALCLITFKRLNQSSDIKSLKSIVDFAVKFVRIAPQTSSEAIARSLIEHCLISTVPIERTCLIAKCIYKFAPICAEAISKHYSQLVNFSENISTQPDSEVCISFLIGTIFRASRSHSATNIPSHQVHTLIKSLQHSPYATYLIARQALYFGCHTFALETFDTISTKVDSEHNHHWLTHLNTLAMALQPNQNDAECHLGSSLSSLRACLNELQTNHSSVSGGKDNKKNKDYETGSRQNSGFQVEFIQWHITRVNYERDLMLFLNCNFKNDVVKINPFRLQEYIINFKSLADRIQVVAHSHYGIDAESELLLHSMMLYCLVVVDSLLRFSNHSVSNLKFPSSTSIQKECSRIHKEVVRMQPGNVDVLIHHILMPLLSVPHQIPPYYFVVSRHTFVQLEIEANKKHMGTSTANVVNRAIGSTVAQVGQGLVVHFSGYIRTDKPGIKSIAIELTGVGADQSQQLVEASIIEDSFQAQSVLHFDVEGLHQVNVKLKLLDSSRKYWHTRINQQIMIQVDPIKVNTRLAAFT
ncbi:integrator complex subunit 7 [Acrasis kona]|uniref:Integrator complex subunit 7 n=1 Tax=Acrasis kona TaxID=1008807 RepID=A0AAW2YYX1_9EUKA